MELLRIIAMALVLVVHADFVALGMPDASFIASFFPQALSRTFTEMLALCCVNVFVLISGWFSIRPSVAGFCAFVFQCVYFYAGCYLALLVVGAVPFTGSSFMQIFLFKVNWFITAYMGLYILSPLLNAFVERVSGRTLGLWLLAFYIFQTLYGFDGSAGFIEYGYSTFSFCGLYLLARWLRLYSGYEAVRRRRWLIIYLSCAVLLTLCYLLDGGVHYRALTAYSNPLCVAESAALLLFFASWRMPYIRVINYIARSAFATFLFHINPWIFFPLYITGIRWIAARFDGLAFAGLALLFMTLIYAVAVLLDIPRRWLWQRISPVLRSRFSQSVKNA